MSFSEIEQIKECRSVRELSELWNAKVKEWSQLSKDQAEELIRVKDKHKAKLELFEEWSYWHEERACIMEFDGGLSRDDAEEQAREGMARSVI